ncbi:MAG: hypothetical protein SWY16_09300 [Cyanobacteriota bacterium]|nr:hypothetical protein [Cyanobacteriota bacterium]
MKNLLPISALAFLFVCIYYFDINASWANNFPWVLWNSYHQALRSSDLGELLSRLSLSFVSGFIIFYLTSYLPKKEAQKHGLICIHFETSILVKRCYKILKDLTNSSECLISLEGITVGDCKKVFENLDEGAYYRKNLENSEIEIAGLAGLVTACEEMKDTEDSIAKYFPFLDSQLVFFIK